jgi:hypothetical protein
MATQGLVAVTRPDGKVVMKIVAGCEGYRAPLVADQLKREWPVTVERAYEIAKSVGFGCDDCLVAMSDSQIKNETDDEPGPLYQSTFENPRFNPRWIQGTAEHTVVITVPE